jgi:two-component system response regulator AtoC
MKTDVPDPSSPGGIGSGNGSAWFVEGVSPSIQALEKVIQELAGNDVPVLLSGEPGSGKKATAQRIHQLSHRGRGPFQVVACSVLEAGGLDAIAAADAPAGTVFLEEITQLRADVQKALVEILPGTNGNGTHSAPQARLIGGTASDLESEVRTGRFREDLYYRISGVSLRLPPLRQRKEDIPHLIEFFLSKYSADYQRPGPALSATTRQLFVDYPWPGNLKELAAAARAIVLLGDESLAMGGLRSMLVKTDRGNGARVSLKEAAKAASRQAEKELILKVLNRTRWNRRRAAQELQISYKALLYKLKQIGCEEYGAS